MTENETQAAAAAPAAAPASEGTTPAKEPVRRRTRTAKAAASQDAVPTEAAEEPKTPARRTRRKKSEDAAPAEAAALAQDAAPADEQPAKPRRTRRKKADDAPAEAAAEATPVKEQEAATAEKPARKRRKKSDDAAAAEADAPAEKAEKADKPAKADGADRPVKGDAAQEAPQESKADKPEKGEKSEKSDKPEKGDKGKSGKQQGRERERDRRRQRRQRNERNREVAPSVTREELAELKVADLRAKAAELELDVKGLKKAELVEAVFAATVKAEGFIDVQGVLDILPDGYGFLRTQGYLPGESDVYVGANLIRRNGLRKGDLVSGKTRPTRENEKFAAIHKIERVNGRDLESLGKRVRFADLTPIYPDERLWMEHGKNTITARVIDLTAPIGKGQRGLIVSPPKAGKTTILKDIAAAITANNPEVHLMCLLVDERPEEVTDMERSIRGEVISSTFDMPCENHIAVAELVIERAKRLVEEGKDVVVLLDSLTRLARAYNLAQPASGRILSGGVDSTALYPPKKFLGAARNIENGGSLTILASALVETGSKMDEVIFEEFKGTGNMELKLDRALADRRIFPAIDPIASGTRKEDLLLQPQEAPLIWAVRRILSNMNSTERSMDTLIKSLKQTDTNAEFLVRTARKAHGGKSESDMSL
ncbi:MAG: transcription termination factor Rho [Coriobacteriia bacterium]|nr:transcription termination factor Rho [Coriobacteriia bacterium]